MSQNQDFIRLSKLMGLRRICSRREADRYIEKGWVKVDGQVIDQLGTKVSPDAQIEITAAGQKIQEEKVTILLNKPVGFVSCQPEDGYEEAKVLIIEENQDPRDQKKRLHPRHLKKLSVAGRLDINSKGLLVLTQDGRVAKEIIGETHHLEKEYQVWVHGHVSPDILKQLRHGLSLDGRALKPCKVQVLRPGELRFILKEGRKRQIRRMCDIVGLKVKGIRRVRIGKVHLDGLEEGHWRFLRADESF